MIWPMAFKVPACARARRFATSLYSPRRLMLKIKGLVFTDTLILPPHLWHIENRLIKRLRYLSRSASQQVQLARLKPNTSGWLWKGFFLRLVMQTLDLLWGGWISYAFNVKLAEDDWLISHFNNLYWQKLVVGLKIKRYWRDSDKVFFQYCGLCRYFSSSVTGIAMSR